MGKNFLRLALSELDNLATKPDLRTTVNTIGKHKPMAKLNIIPAIALACFSRALGEHFPKVCNDTKSFLGRLEKDIVTTGGEWKATNAGKLKSKDGNEVAMPLNNPLSVLLLFGLQVNELAKRGDFGGAFKLNEAKDGVEHIGIECELPKAVHSWFNDMVTQAKNKPAKPETEKV